MKNNIYTILDEKAKAYTTPFFLPNDAVAIRAFTNMVNDDSSDFGRNPHDFTMYKIAEFDVLEGKINTQNKELIKTGAECLTPITLKEATSDG